MKNPQLRDVTLRTRQPDLRHAVQITAVDGVRLDNVNLTPAAAAAAP